MFTTAFACGEKDFVLCLSFLSLVPHAGTFVRHNLFVGSFCFLVHPCNTIALRFPKWCSLVVRDLVVHFAVTKSEIEL